MLKNKTLLVETTRKTQTENLKKMTTFFGVPVEVTEHTTLNSSKGIIRNKILKTEDNILEYLKPQGVTHVKRFKVKRNNDYINTNTLLLTFNTIVPPKSLKIVYEIIPVDIYIPNPLRCFNCQKFGHHENNCPVVDGSVCENCGTGGDDHRTSRCTNPAKCVNCNGNHVSRSSECQVWKKEKEIMKIKVTQRLTYPEARKTYEQHKPEFTFSKVVSAMPVKETKTASTQFNENDFKITESSKVITARKPKQTVTPQSSTSQNNTSPKNQPSNSSNKQKQISASNRMQKGSLDPIQQHNRFGALGDDDAMETSEATTRPSSRGHRPLSPIKAPK